MGSVDFPTWFGVGCYGGLACDLLAAAGVAGYALLRHRGTPRQLARAILVCLGASCLMLAAIWWHQNRLDLYGPALPPGEVLLALSATALLGWFVPLGMLAGYALLAGPQSALAPVTWRRAAEDAALASLDDPARRIEPLGDGKPWGRLVPVDGEFAGQVLQLTRKLTLLGREYNNDIVIDDERTSRYHAEIHWDHGHVEIVDRGSMNGTLVNRQAVRGRIPLKTGDVLDLGAQRYRLEIMPGGVPGADDARSRDEETRKMPGAVPVGADQHEQHATPLVLTGGEQAGSRGRWELSQAVVSIGRDQERTICLPHESVSRLHAQIVRQRTGYFVSDLNSSNGTFLNGQPLAAPTLLSPGDVLRVGEIELRCEAHPFSPPVADPAAPVSGEAGTEGGAAEADAQITMLADGVPVIVSPLMEPGAARLGPPRLTGSLPQGERDGAS